MTRRRPRLRRLATGLLGLCVSLAAAGALLEQGARWRAAREFPPSGRIVGVEGRDAHIDCRGEGTPTLVLEAGLDAGGSYAWAPVHDELASLSRACAYDRAGILWSDRGAEPRDAHHVADELHALLAAADEPPPYVMVAHSLGGPLVRVFDARYPGEVEGFVFVDSSHPEQVSRLPAAAVRPAQNGPVSLARAFRTLGIMRITGPRATDMRSAHVVRTLPGIVAERNGIQAMFEQARATGSLGARPTVVLTAGERPGRPDLSAEMNERVSATWFALQTELAGLSTNSDHRTIPGATHYIQVDAPESVITAVRDVLDAVRSGRAVRRQESPM